MTNNTQNEISLDIKIADVCLGIYKYLKSNASHLLDVKLASAPKKGLICYNKAFKPEDFDLELSKILRQYKIEKYGADSEDSSAA